MHRRFSAARGQSFRLRWPIWGKRWLRWVCSYRVFITNSIINFPDSAASRHKQKLRRQASDQAADRGRTNSRLNSRLNKLDRNKPPLRGFQLISLSQVLVSTTRQLKGLVAAANYFLSRITATQTRARDNFELAKQNMRKHADARRRTAERTAVLNVGVTINAGTSCKVLTKICLYIIIMRLVRNSTFMIFNEKDSSRPVDYYHGESTERMQGNANASAVP